MGYSFSCGDVIPGCPARFDADTEDGVLAEVGRHAAGDHGMTEITPEILQQVRDRITQH